MDVPLTETFLAYPRTSLEMEGPLDFDSYSWEGANLDLITSIIDNSKASFYICNAQGQYLDIQKLTWDCWKRPKFKICRKMVNGQLLVVLK